VVGYDDLPRVEGGRVTGDDGVHLDGEAVDSLLVVVDRRSKVGVGTAGAGVVRGSGKDEEGKGQECEEGCRKHDRGYGNVVRRGRLVWKGEGMLAS
jgi:hypothetical protein